MALPEPASSTWGPQWAAVPTSSVAMSSKEKSFSSIACLRLSEMSLSFLCF